MSGRNSLYVSKNSVKNLRFNVKFNFVVRLFKCSCMEHVVEYIALCVTWYLYAQLLRNYLPPCTLVSIIIITLHPGVPSKACSQSTPRPASPIQIQSCDTWNLFFEHGWFLILRKWSPVEVVDDKNVIVQVYSSILFQDQNPNAKGN